jgi:hypothetical protein
MRSFGCHRFKYSLVLERFACNSHIHHDFVAAPQLRFLTPGFSS